MKLLEQISDSFGVKTIAILFFVFGVLFILSSCSVQDKPITSKQLNEPSSTIKRNVESNSFEQKEKISDIAVLEKYCTSRASEPCFAALALISNDEKYCNNSINASKDNFCFSILNEFRTKGEETCSSLAQKDDKNQFISIKDHCYTWYSLYKKNMNYCEKAGYNAHICYKQYGIYFNSDAACGKVMKYPDVSLEYFGETDAVCTTKKDALWKGVSSCGKRIPTTYESFNSVNFCYYTLAQINQESTYCENMFVDLAGQGARQYDKGFCYIDIAIAKKDPSVCDRITFFTNNSQIFFAPLSIYNSIEEAAAANKSEIMHTNLMSKLNFRKSDCYSQLSLLTNNITLCRKSTGHLPECLSEFAIKTKDYSLCEEVPLPEDKTRFINQRDECFKYISLNNTDVAICDKITTPEMKSHCYYFAGQEITDESLCPYTRNINECYENARKKK